MNPSYLVAEGKAGCLHKDKVDRGGKKEDILPGAGLPLGRRAWLHSRGTRTWHCALSQRGSSNHILVLQLQLIFAFSLSPYLFQITSFVRFLEEYLLHFTQGTSQTPYLAYLALRGVTSATSPTR